MDGCSVVAVSSYNHGVNHPSTRKIGQKEAILRFYAAKTRNEHALISYLYYF
jgi:hypothetical protein